MIYKAFGKRLLDLILASSMAIILFPLFFIVAAILIFYHQGSPFFYQSRPGYKGVVFQIIKFKTMLDLTDQSGKVLPDEKRVFGLGKLIRKFSLDEIPQLFNVIRGDMSLVGPRPLLVEYLELYTEEQHKRHLVKPGVTGWAQINGRNTISWRQKFNYDIWYVQNCSLSLDLKILVVTFWNVILGKGVSQQGHVTVGKFDGTN